jgi:hypothetical protein
MIARLQEKRKLLFISPPRFRMEQPIKNKYCLSVVFSSSLELRMIERQKEIIDRTLRDGCRVSFTVQTEMGKSL